MITVALTHLLSRGVRLDTAEALAVAQAAAAGPGTPAIDNLEVSSDGSVRCMNRSGAPSVAALAALLQSLLPASGVPPALHYTVARGAGSVVAPPFASIDEFCQTLARFETRERSGVLRQLVARGARPGVAASPRRSLEPAGEVVLQRVWWPAPQPRGYRGRAAAVVAALLLSAACGFFGAQYVRAQKGSSSPPAPAEQLRPRDTGEATPVGTAGGNGTRVARDRWER